MSLLPTYKNDVRLGGIDVSTGRLFLAVTQTLKVN